jgi:hypothetical protein
LRSIKEEKEMAEKKDVMAAEAVAAPIGIPDPANVAIGDTIGFTFNNGYGDTVTRPALVSGIPLPNHVNIHVFTDGPYDGFREGTTMWKAKVKYDAKKTPDTWCFIG